LRRLALDGAPLERWIAVEEVADRLAPEDHGPRELDRVLRRIGGERRLRPDAAGERGERAVRGLDAVRRAWRRVPITAKRREPAGRLRALRLRRLVEEDGQLPVAVLPPPDRGVMALRQPAEAVSEPRVRG